MLFSIPRSLLLNIANSKLPNLLSSDEVQTLRCTGWTLLILCMMWESNQPDSLWHDYFAIMPTQFDSLMFWSESELAALSGCAVLSESCFYFDS